MLWPWGRVDMQLATAAQQDFLCIPRIFAPRCFIGALDMQLMYPRYVYSNIRPCQIKVQWVQLQSGTLWLLALSRALFGDLADV